MCCITSTKKLNSANISDLSFVWKNSSGLTTTGQTSCSIRNLGRPWLLMNLKVVLVHPYWHSYWYLIIQRLSYTKNGISWKKVHLQKKLAKFPLLGMNREMHLIYRFSFMCFTLMFTYKRMRRNLPKMHIPPKLQQFEIFH